jgi:hypothetical protein
MGRPRDARIRMARATSCQIQHFTTLVSAELAPIIECLAFGPPSGRGCRFVRSPLSLLLVVSAQDRPTSPALVLFLRAYATSAGRQPLTGYHRATRHPTLCVHLRNRILRLILRRTAGAGAAAIARSSSSICCS